MRKQFKKGVAILSAVSMVAAGISYVPQNVKADAPAIAVQDSEKEWIIQALHIHK